MSETENVSFKTYDARGNGDGETTCTLTGNHQSFVSDYNCHDNGESRTPTLIVENHPQDSRVKIKEDGIVQTLDARMGEGGGNVPMCMENSVNAVVRRLTPLECERLQGYPDGWTDIGEWTDSKGKKHKEADSPRYKALGNSIALPYWIELAKKVAESLGEENLTMGSLFDGIGGFPLAFSMAGVKPIWASEIEEFPIAVTKRRFPDAEEEQLRSEQDTDKD